MFKEWAGLLAERIRRVRGAEEARNNERNAEDAPSDSLRARVRWRRWRVCRLRLRPCDGCNQPWRRTAHGQWTVDQNGNPSRAQLVDENGQPKVNSDGTPVVSQGESDAAALAKGVAGAAAERFIWMGLGKVVKSVGGALVKNVPGLDKMLGKVAGKPLACRRLEKKLRKSEGGRWLPQDRRDLSNVNDTIHVDPCLR